MKELKKLIEAVVQELFDVEVEVDLMVAPENTGADYATNVAMKLAKLVHKASMVIGEMIKSELDGRENFGVEITLAMPGFLNFRMRDGYFAEKVSQMVEKVDPGINTYQNKVVVAEFSDPNPFKVLHVGHLYTSVVGDSISRLLELAGGKVVRVNFGGDVGLHVGKTLYALDSSFSRTVSLDSPVRGSSTLSTASLRALSLPSISSKNTSSKEDSTKITSSEEGDDIKNVETSRISLKIASSKKNENEKFDSVDEEAWRKFLDRLKIEDIAKCYVEGTRAYDEDEEARAEITALNKEIYRINAEDIHDTLVAQLYWRGRELSYQYFEDFYARIGVHFDKFYPESMVAGRGLQEVRDYVGTVYEESDGAIVYRGEKIGLHTRVFINREGVPTYEAKDVGLIFTKWDDWHFDESVVVTGNEQTDYMKVVLASVAEYAPELVEHTTHLTHGLVKLPGNVKMSSRKGNFLKAVDVLEMVREILGGEKADERLVLAAIKYAFLKYKMGGDIVFDPQESVSMTGNSGIYIIYSAVRARKILAKNESESWQMDLGNLRNLEKLDGREKLFVRKLNKKLTQYFEVLREALSEKSPHRICAYLYELAQEFSRFYENVHVAGHKYQRELLEIVRAYANVMEHGLGLLGIEAPEEM